MPLLSKAPKSSKAKHKRKDKLFSSSDSSEFDSDSLSTPSLNLHDKAIVPEASTLAVKKVMENSRKTDKMAISNPPLVAMGTTALDNAGSDSSSSSNEPSDVMLVTAPKSVLPNIVHNDTADITSFAYDETLLVENSKVSICVCLFCVVYFTMKK